MDPITSNGTVYLTGLRPAGPKMQAAAEYTAAFDLIPEADWPDRGGGLRDFFPFDWDQNPNNSCGGHGAGAAFNTAWNFQGEELKEFSPDFLYALCNGGSDNGSMPDDLLEELQRTGVCLRATGPHGKIYRQQYGQTAVAEAGRFRADQVFTFRTFAELATAVLRRQACFTGIFCGNSFNPDAAGRLPEWDRATNRLGQYVGGHCTAQIGELEKVAGRGWGVWTRNSWGRRWGKDGWAWTPRSYFDGGLPVFLGCAVVSCRRDPQDVEPAPVAG